MTSPTDYERGKRDGIRWAVTCLHKVAAETKDPRAVAALNSAAFHLGSDGTAGSEMCAYLVDGGDELAAERAAHEYTLGALGQEIALHTETMKELDAERQTRRPHA